MGTRITYLTLSSTICGITGRTLDTTLIRTVICWGIPTTIHTSVICTNLTLTGTVTIIQAIYTSFCCVFIVLPTWTIRTHVTGTNLALARTMRIIQTIHTAGSCIFIILPSRASYTTVT